LAEKSADVIAVILRRIKDRIVPGTKPPVGGMMPVQLLVRNKVVSLPSGSRNRVTKLVSPIDAWSIEIPGLAEGEQAYVGINQRLQRLSGLASVRRRRNNDSESVPGDENRHQRI